MTNVSLSLLVRAGRKVTCPVCGKDFMSESYRPLSSSGIGQHIRSKHPEMGRAVLMASKISEQETKISEIAIRKEKNERPKRKFTVTGAFLDEISEEINHLIGCMEAYYFQGGGDKSALEMIARIENMHEQARNAAK